MKLLVCLPHTRKDELARIKAYVEANLSALKQDGELYSNAVMLHNAMLNLIAYLESTRIDSPERALHMIIECKDYIRRNP